MQRGWINYFFDLALALNALFMATTGLIMWLVLPCTGGGERGFRGGRAVTEAIRPESFIGVDRQTWRVLHEWAGVALLCLISAHLILHWGWIKQMTKRLLDYSNDSKQ